MPKLNLKQGIQVFFLLAGIIIAIITVILLWKWSRTVFFLFGLGCTAYVLWWQHKWDQKLPSSGLFKEEISEISVPSKSKRTAHNEQKEQHKNTEENTEKEPYFSLVKHGQDLTALAKQGQIKTIWGREEEIRDVIRVLISPDKKNPLLIGEPGVGKTAIIHGLAQKIVAGNVNPFLKQKRIIELRTSELEAGSGVVGVFDERINQILKQVEEDPNIIIFIDEIHTIIGTGTHSNRSTGMADMIKPNLASGKFCCIGATTNYEFNRYIKKDEALERRFHIINVQELSEEATKKLLKSYKQSLEKRYKVNISDKISDLIVDLSVRYLINKQLPDKALDILTLSCTTAFDKNVATVEQSLVEEIVKKKSGIPIIRLSESKERDKYARLANILKANLFGQDEAVDAISAAMKKIAVEMQDPKRPSVFLFSGPAGVGKSELSKVLACVIYGSKDKMIQIDMSEQSGIESANKLFGTPPGYEGHDVEGQLTGKLMANPASIVLLDEVEKAHPSVFIRFLQAFEDGRLTDSKSRQIDVRHAVFIMTSNLTKDQIDEIFPREFRDRIDRIIEFKPLSQEAKRNIAIKLFRDLEQERLKTKGISLQVDESAINALCEQGYNSEEGARGLRRCLENLVVQPLTDKILNNEICEGDRIRMYSLDRKAIIIQKSGERGQRTQGHNAQAINRDEFGFKVKSKLKLFENTETSFS